MYYTGKEGRIIRQKILNGKYVHAMEGLYNIKDTKLIEHFKEIYTLNYKGSFIKNSFTYELFNTLDRIKYIINKLYFLKNDNPNIIIAGGSLLSILVFENTNFSDIDVYFRKHFDKKLVKKIAKHYLFSYGTERAITLRHLIDQESKNIFQNTSFKYKCIDKKETLKNISDALKHSISVKNNDINYSYPDLIKMNMYTEAVYNDDINILCKKPLQFIKMTVDSPAKLLHLFDIPLCQICYYMGEIYVTEAWIMSYFYKKNIIFFKESENFTKRFLKYNKEKGIPFMFVNFNAQFINSNYLLDYDRKSISYHSENEYTTLMTIKNYFTTDKKRTGVYNILENDLSINGIVGNNIKYIFQSLSLRVPNNLDFSKETKMIHFKKKQKKESIYDVFSTHVKLSDISIVLNNHILPEIGHIIIEYLNYPQSYYDNTLFRTIVYPNKREIKPMLITKYHTFKDSISYDYIYKKWKLETPEEKRKTDYPNLFTRNLTFIQKKFLKYRTVKNESNFLDKILIKKENKYSYVYKRLVIYIDLFVDDNKSHTEIEIKLNDHRAIITTLFEDNNSFVVIDYDELNNI